MEFRPYTEWLSHSPSGLLKRAKGTFALDIKPHLWGRMEYELYTNLLGHNQWSPGERSAFLSVKDLSLRIATQSFNPRVNILCSESFNHQKHETISWGAISPQEKGYYEFFPSEYGLKLE